MNKLKLFVYVAMLCSVGTVYAQKKTTLSSEIYGYKKEMVVSRQPQSSLLTLNLIP